MSEEKKLNGTVIVTYRCNARCSMCNRYKAPSKPEQAGRGNQHRNHQEAAEDVLH